MVQEGCLVSYMRTTSMECSQQSYDHDEEIIGLHVNMGNVETESNGRKDRKETVTMRSLHREV
jgi:predicted thioesterase